MLAFMSVETAAALVIHDLRPMTGRDGPWVATPKAATRAPRGVKVSERSRPLHSGRKRQQLQRGRHPSTAPSPLANAPSLLDFSHINAVARSVLPQLLATRWLPHGRRVGAEWVAINPTRSDRSPGSFKVNLMTARWSDFATGDRGGDPISLLAYLSGLSQFAAAKQLASMLSVEGRRGR
jgi:hypothetical protein